MVQTKRRQSGHFALTRAEGPRRRRALAVHRRDSAQEHGHHQWPCSGLSARSGGQVLKQERVPQRRHSVTAWMVLTKLRVNLGLTIATMAE